MRESGFFDITDLRSTSSDSSFDDERRVPIITTAHYAIYRIDRDGKHFIFKTPVEANERLERLLRKEYELLVSCSHPNIINVYNFGRDSSLGVGVLMEYVDGQTLDEFLEGNPEKNKKDKVFEQLIDAVGYLHKKGVVHNDLKPHNILISRHGENLKIIDFGFSDNDAYFLLKTPGYTPHYASPELINSRETDCRSDIYSIGKIMQDMFGSRYKRISSKCTRLDPSKRFADTDQLKKAWNRRNHLSRYITLLTGIAVCVFLFFFVYSRYNAPSVENLQTPAQEQFTKAAQTESALVNEDQSAIETEPSTQDGREQISGQHAPENPYKENLEGSEPNKIEGPEDNIKKSVDAFTLALDEMSNEFNKKLSLCKNQKEVDELLEQYKKELLGYYNKTDKVIDGEDITHGLFFNVMDRFDRDRRYAESYVKAELPDE